MSSEFCVLYVPDSLAHDKNQFPERFLLVLNVGYKRAEVLPRTAGCVLSSERRDFVRAHLDQQWVVAPHSSCVIDYDRNSSATASARAARPARRSVRAAVSAVDSPADITASVSRRRAGRSGPALRTLARGERVCVPGAAAPD